MCAEKRAKDKLLLAMDLGNTKLGCAVFRGREMVAKVSIPAGELSARASMWDGRLEAGLIDNVEAAIMSSVNPRRASLVRASLKERLGKPPLLLGADVQVPVEVRVDRPEEVGTDRLLCVAAAYERKHAACLIVDLGTALTVDVCSSDGAYVGGVIAPGLEMSATALHDHTALLPKVEVTAAESVTGTNTVDCINSGLYWGTVSMIDGLVARLRQEHGRVEYVLGTGGGMKIISKAVTVINEIIPDLHFEGLMLSAAAAGLIP